MDEFKEGMPGGHEPEEGAPEAGSPEPAGPPAGPGPEEPTAAPEEPTAELPSFPGRLVKVFVSPGELFQALRERPVWFGVLALGAVLVVLSIALIPVEVWDQFMREQLRRQGRPVPDQMPGGSVIRISSMLGGGIMWFVWALILAGVMTLIFSFLLGDEGRFKQYLSVASHGLFIAAVGALLTVPLRIAQGDPQVTLSLGSFAFFLEEGYLYRVLRMLDLFQLWGYGVMAVGVSRIDPRRSAGSAATVLYGLAVAVALIFGIFGG